MRLPLECVLPLVWFGCQLGFALCDVADVLGRRAQRRRAGVVG